MFAPLRIFLWMKKNKAGKLQRDYLVHVGHAGNHILEIADPDVIGERVFLKPLPRARAYSRVTRNVALLEANEFVEQHHGLNHVGRIWPHGSAICSSVPRVTPYGPGRVFLVANLVILYQSIRGADGRS